MTGLGITGWAVLSSAGVGPEAMARRLTAGVVPPPIPGVGMLYAEALPSPNPRVLADFDVRQHLGRKGTAFLDRRNALALVACGQALQDGGLQVDDSNRHRIGIVLGTTLGSLRSMCDFTRDTLVERRPYLVNAALFPNTVMNCASGQAAIWNGIQGVNATLAGGRLAFLNVLQYSARVLRRNYADVLLAGAVEEFTPHTAWATHIDAGAESAFEAGEGAAVFLVGRAGSRREIAWVRSLAIGFCPGGHGPALAQALERCVRRVLDEANIEPREVSLAVTCESAGDEPGDVELAALSAVFPEKRPETLSLKEMFGECHAASGAFQLAAILALQRYSGRGCGTSLMTAWTRDGGFGAAVIEGKDAGG